MTVSTLLQHETLLKPDHYGTYASFSSLVGTKKAERTALSFTPGSGAAWSQFTGSVAVDYHGTKNQRYISFAQADGGVGVASVDLDSGAVTTFTLHATFASPANDHSAPALVVRPDGRLVAFYAQQGGSVIFYRISTNAEDVTAWGTEQSLTTEQAQYPYPHYIGARLFVFYTAGATSRVMYSDDNGATWTGPLLWLSVYPNPSLYYQLRSNGSRVDFIMSMHPNSSGSGYASLSSMYHGYFDGTTFRDSAGTAITTLAALPTIASPTAYTQTGGMTVTSLTKVYDYTANGVCWAWDVRCDPKGNVACVFTSYPGAALGNTWASQPTHFTDHRINYYAWNGAAWVGGQMAVGAKLTDNWVDGFAEYQYDGGAAILHTDATVVYVSRPVAPSNQFEIERWSTADKGTTWTTAAVTLESAPRKKQCKPYTPMNLTAGAPEVVWMSGNVYDYTSFDCAVVVTPPPAADQVRTALAVRPKGAGTNDALIAPALAVTPNLLLPLAADINDISGNANFVKSKVTPLTFGAGRYGDRTALVFDGSQQCLHTLSKPFTAGSINTFFGWAYRANHSAAHTLFGSDNSGSTNTEAGLRLNSGNQGIQFWANTSLSAGAGSVNWSNAWPGDAQWAHWALIVDMTAQTVELYINGVSKGVNSYTTPWGDANNYLEFGHYSGFRATNPSSPFNGRMANVGWYAGALTATQIQNMAGYVSGSQDANQAVSSLISRLKAVGAVGVDGTTVGSAPASHVDLANAARNVLSETIPMGTIQGVSTIPSGELTGLLLGLKAGEVVKGLLFNLTMNSVTLTLFRVALYSLTGGTLLASSADQSGTINSSNLKQIPFSSPYTVLASGAYYAALLPVYSAGTVQVSRGAAASALSIAVDSGAFQMVKQTGLTDLSSPASFVTGNTAFAAYHVGAYQ